MTVETREDLPDLGDIGHGAPLAMVTADTSLEMQCEPISLAALEEHRAAWQWLADNAVDDNPFLTPAFMIPLMMQTDLEADVTFIAIWRQTTPQRQLVGLVPLVADRWNAAKGLLGRGQARLWKHACQPFALPLLAGPERDAELALAAFSTWLIKRWPRIGAFVADDVDTGSRFCEMLAAQSMERQWPLQRGVDRSSTHGLDFKPAGAMPCAASVRILNTVLDIRSGIERMLAFDATSHDRRESGAAVLFDPQHAAFLRAGIRSFAREGRVVLAMLEDRAGAVVIAGRERGYLWWLSGPDENNPMIEAALASAAEKHLCKPVVAACRKPLAGLWAQPIHTENWLVPLHAGRRAINTGVPPSSS